MTTIDHQQAAIDEVAKAIDTSLAGESWGEFTTRVTAAATPHLRAAFAEEHGIGDATSRPLYDAKTKIGQLTNHLEHAHSVERSLRVANEGWQRENEELQDKIRAIQAVLHDWERDEDSKGLHQDILALLEGGGE